MTLLEAVTREIFFYVQSYCHVRESGCNSIYESQIFFGCLLKAAKYYLACIAPVFVRKVHMDLPCGKCYECVKRRRNDWYIRCRYQAMISKYVYFGTLTYSHLVANELRKRDAQLFLKRLRSYGIRLSYLIVGEYGEKRGRAHWHYLFFSGEPISVPLVVKAWQGGFGNEPNISGFVKHELIRSKKALRYIVKYLYKYMDGEAKFSLLVSKNPAIGKSFVDKNQVYYLSERHARLRFEGSPVAMPRYYKRKIFDDYPDIKEEVNSALAAKVAELADEELKIARSLYPNLSDQEILRQIQESKFKFNEEERRKIERDSR